MIALLLATLSHAQEAADWKPAAGVLFGRGGTLAESPRVAEGELGFGLTSGFADGTASEGLALVGLASVAASDRVRIDLSVPFWPFVETEGFSGPAAGSVGVQGVVPVTRGPTAFAVIPRLGLPTGTDAAWLEGGPSAGLLLSIAGGRRLDWTLHAGPTWAPVRALTPNQTSGSSVAVAGAAAWSAQPGFRLGAEAAGTAGLGGSVSSADLLFFAQNRRTEGIGLTVAGGLGLGPAAPTSRVTATVSWAPADPPEDPDPDGDGLTRDDRCPTAAEDTDGWEDADGCPEADNDSDTVADGADQCPTTFGPVTAQGCPDTDSDGRHDGIDTCPTAAGPPRERADLADGCPKRAWATAKRIELAGPIRFDLSGRLVEGADDLATAAAYLLAHPTLGRVEIAGHMAAGWTPAEAQGLSRVRAERVQEVLIGAGVSDAQLTAVGYGDTRPLDTNRLPSGRARNERIELVLLDPQ